MTHAEILKLTKEVEDSLFQITTKKDLLSMKEAGHLARLVVIMETDDLLKTKEVKGVVCEALGAYQSYTNWELMSYPLLTVSATNNSELVGWGVKSSRWTAYIKLRDLKRFQNLIIETSLTNADQKIKEVFEEAQEFNKDLL